jgi:hypothetical protein
MQCYFCFQDDQQQMHPLSLVHQVDCQCAIHPIIKTVSSYEKWVSQPPYTHQVPNIVSTNQWYLARAALTLQSPNPNTLWQWYFDFISQETSFIHLYTDRGTFEILQTLPYLLHISPPQAIEMTEIISTFS